MRDETKASRFVRADAPPDTKRVMLRASGNARLFGITLEAASGAVVDNLGIVNATAKSIARSRSRRSPARAARVTARRIS